MQQFPLASVELVNRYEQQRDRALRIANQSALQQETLREMAKDMQDAAEAHSRFMQDTLKELSATQQSVADLDRDNVSIDEETAAVRRNIHRLELQMEETQVLLARYFVPHQQYSTGITIDEVIGPRSLIQAPVAAAQSVSKGATVAARPSGAALRRTITELRAQIEAYESALRHDGAESRSAAIARVDAEVFQASRSHSSPPRVAATEEAATDKRPSNTQPAAPRPRLHKPAPSRRALGSASARYQWSAFRCVGEVTYSKLCLKEQRGLFHPSSVDPPHVV